MIFRRTALLSLFLAAASGVAFAQTRTTGANPGITPPPQPVAPNAGSGSSTNQAVPGAGAQGSGGATNQANPSRRVSRRQNHVANTRQTTVNQAGTALDQTAARRQGDMTEQRRAGTSTTTTTTTNEVP
jgi:hypothetical protein